MRAVSLLVANPVHANCGFKRSDAFNDNALQMMGLAGLGSPPRTKRRLPPRLDQRSCFLSRGFGSRSERWARLCLCFRGTGSSVGAEKQRGVRGREGVRSPASLVASNLDLHSHEGWERRPKKKKNAERCPKHGSVCCFREAVPPDRRGTGQSLRAPPGQPLRQSQASARRAHGSTQPSLKRCF